MGSTHACLLIVYQDAFQLGRGWGLAVEEICFVRLVRGKDGPSIPHMHDLEPLRTHTFSLPLSTTTLVFSCPFRTSIEPGFVASTPPGLKLSAQHPAHWSPHVALDLLVLGDSQRKE